MKWLRKGIRSLRRKPRFKKLVKKLSRPSQRNLLKGADDDEE